MAKQPAASASNLTRPAEEPDSANESSKSTMPSAEPAAELGDNGTDDHGPLDSPLSHPSDGETGYGISDKPRLKPSSVVRLGAAMGLVFVVSLGGLASWLGYQAYEAHRGQQQREQLLQVGRQGALNLTSIDWQHADNDVQRILNSATGSFYDEFSKRSQSLIDVVKQAQSTSVGTITEAGLESVSGQEAQVLVAVNVHTTNAGAPEQAPRDWRMRVSVQKVGNEAKVSNVAFVP
ncbi:MAG: Mce-associated rane protein [Mycobacterium sp.]|jgi:Mce-associated membrane protein|nr:Mce-associated rane protein [Mycobacterium sp.]